MAMPWAQFTLYGQIYTCEWDEHGQLIVTNEKQPVMPADHPIVLEATRFHEKMNAALERSMRPM